MKKIFIVTCCLIVNAVYSQTQIGQDINEPVAEAYGSKSGWTNGVSMPDNKTIAIGAWGNDGNGTNSGQVRVFSLVGSIWTQKGTDIDGEAAYDLSGWSVCMPDSNTVAIGAKFNAGNGTDAGHVRIYNWNGTSWVQKGADIDGESAGDLSGWSVDMPDSNVVAIGAIENDGGGSQKGHVRIYRWNGTSWNQVGADIDGEYTSDKSGYSVSMPDTNTVAIGAIFNDDLTAGSNAGHVRIYNWNGSAWIQKGLDIVGEIAGDESGWSVSMPDSNTVAIGSYLNDGNGTDAGHVRIFEWSGTAWNQKGLDIDGVSAYDMSGYAVSMPNPNTVAIGAPGNDDNGNASGHVRIFQWNGSAWLQRGNDIDGELAAEEAGKSICMPDANTVIIGAPGNGEIALSAGQVRVYCIPPMVDTPVDDTICGAYTLPQLISGKYYTGPNGTGSILNAGTIIGATQTLYTFDSTMCGTDESSFTITISSIPSTPTTISGNTTICSGESTSYSITTVSGATSYTWTLPGGWTGSSSSNTINVVSGTSSGDITVTANNSCGSSSPQTLSITVNNTPNVSASSDTTICEGESVTLSANGATSYSWDNGAGSNSNVSVTPGMATTYIVTGTTNGCVDKDTVVVSVNSVPVVTVSADITICQGQSASLFASGALSIAWDNGAGNTPNVSVSPGITTTYTATGTTNGCSASDSVVVTVFPVVTVSASADVSICEGQSTTLTVTGGTNYSWTNGAGTGASVTVSPTTNTTYFVSATGDVCSNSDQVTVSVNDLPFPIVSLSGLTLSTSNFASYQWHLNNSPISGATLPSYTATENGDYNVTVVDGNGCSGSSDVTVVSNVGIQEGLASDISIYPNPSVGSFIIESNFNLIDRVLIFNVQGKSVFDSELNGKKYQIDLAGQPKGIYCVFVNTNTGISTFKVIYK